MPPKKLKTEAPPVSTSVSSAPHAFETHSKLIGVLPVLATKILKSLRLTTRDSERTTLAEDNEATLNALLKYIGETVELTGTELTHFFIPKPIPKDTITFSGVQRLYVHPRGTLLFAAHGRTLRAWRLLPNLQELTIPVARDNEVVPLEFVFSPDGKMLALAYSNEVVLYDVSASNISPMVRHRLEHDGFSIRKIAFHPDSKKLAVAVYAGYEYSIRIWKLNPPTPRMVAILRRNGHSINTLAYSPNGHYLASGGNDRSVCIWNDALPPADPTDPNGIPTPEPLRYLMHPPILWITEIRYDADGLLILTSGGSFHRWALDAEGLPEPTVPPKDDYIQCHYPVFSPNAPVMAVAYGSLIRIRSSRPDQLHDPGNEDVKTLPQQNDTFFTDMVFYKTRMLIGKTDKNIYIFVKHSNGHWVPKPFLMFVTVGTDKMAVDTHSGNLYFVASSKLHTFSLHKLYEYLFPATQAGGAGRARKAGKTKK